MFGYVTLKLWNSPVPSPTKYSNPWWDVDAAAPTKVPVVPIPTLTVDNPIMSLFIFATYKIELLLNGTEDPPLTVETPIVLP